jgi:hypothetical protein
MNGLLSDSVPPTRPQSTRVTGNVDYYRRSCPPLEVQGQRGKTTRATSQPIKYASSEASPYLPVFHPLHDLLFPRQCRLFSPVRIPIAFR